MRIDYEAEQVEENDGDGKISGGTDDIGRNGGASLVEKEMESSKTKPPRLGDAIFGVSNVGSGASGGDKNGAAGSAWNPFSTKSAADIRGGNPFSISGPVQASTKISTPAAAAAAAEAKESLSPSSDPKSSTGAKNNPSVKNTSDLSEQFTSAVQISKGHASESTSTPVIIEPALTSSDSPNRATNAKVTPLPQQKELEQHNQPHEPWPPKTALPPSYPKYPLEADYETLDKTPFSSNIKNNKNNSSNPKSSLFSSSSSSTDAMQIDTTTSTTTTATDEKQIFESSLDRTFQRFADRLAQNPEQVLRYEFGGDPLLYAGRDDAVGELFLVRRKKGDKKKTKKKGEKKDVMLSPTTTTMTTTTMKMAKKEKTPTTTMAMRRKSIPACPNCKSQRVFEVQLTPYAIEKLEEEGLYGCGNSSSNKGGGDGATKTALDGMDWGTIIIAVCLADCRPAGVGIGQVAYLQEWAGVQWEELEGEGQSGK